MGFAQTSVRREGRHANELHIAVDYANLAPHVRYRAIARCTTAHTM